MPSCITYSGGTVSLVSIVVLAKPVNGESLVYRVLMFYAQFVILFHLTGYMHGF